MLRFEQDFNIGELTEVSKVALQVVNRKKKILKIVDPVNKLIAGYQFAVDEGTVKRVVHRINGGMIVRPALYAVSTITFYDRDVSQNGSHRFRTLCALEEAAELHYMLVLEGGCD